MTGVRTRPIGGTSEAGDAASITLPRVVADHSESYFFRRFGRNRTDQRSAAFTSRPGWTMQLSTEVVGDVGVIRVRGDVDSIEAPNLDDAAMALLADGARSLVIDCRDIDFIDSAGLQVMVRAHQEAHATAARSPCAGPAPSPSGSSRPSAWTRCSSSTASPNNRTAPRSTRRLLKNPLVGARVFGGRGGHSVGAGQERSRTLSCWTRRRCAASWCRRAASRRSWLIIAASCSLTSCSRICSRRVGVGRRSRPMWSRR